LTFLRSQFVLAEMKFALRLSRAELLVASKQYLADASEMTREKKAFVAGDRIAAGDLDPNHLVPIVDWKSSRPKSQIKGNDPRHVTEALRVATAAQHERTALAVLCGLRGIGVAMASAISTAINRERFTVIDWRTLKALDVKKSWLTIDDYLDYLAYCRMKAKKHRVSLRDFDRALWIAGGQ
jgi:hypothetical protein